MVKNGTYVHEPVTISKCAKFQGSNFKNDTMIAKNAEITFLASMPIFNELTSIKPWINQWET